VLNVAIAAITVCLLWGSGWLFMKLGVTSFPPLLFAGARDLLAGAVLVAILRLRGRVFPRGAELQKMCAIGAVMLGVSNGITYWGQSRLSSSTAALVFCAMPFLTAIFSHFLLAGQRLDRWRIGGLIIGFLGVWLVVSSRQSSAGSEANAAKLALLCSATIWACCLVLNKKLLPGADSTTMTGVQLLAGGILLTPLGLLTVNSTNVHITPSSISVFLIMVFGQGIIAYVAYYYLMSRVSPASLSMTSFVTPSIAVVLGIVLLHETAYWQMGVGLAAVAAGIIVANVLSRQRREQSPALVME
jgi:drug/metabolite transporter (DMT)-like permease